MEPKPPRPGNPPTPAGSGPQGGADDLAAELAHLAKNDPARLAERVAAMSVREQAELALRLAAPERLELLLHVPRPMRLARALPDSELYLTVREVGPADALPLVALASASQLQHLVDLESWRRDRFDATRSGAWVALLLEAGEPALVRFLRRADDELLALLFLRWLQVEQIETGEPPEIHGLGGTEAGDERGLMSPDGHHLFRPSIPEHAPAIQRFAQILYRDQPERYAAAIEAARWELPAELEEGALRWRNSRLEEHGFPAWDEALSVYAPPEGTVSHPRPLEPEDPDGLGAPRSPLRVLRGGNALASALDAFPEGGRERVLHEIVSLANHLLVADGGDTGDPQAHRRALEKGAGYVGIALEARAAERPEDIRRVLEERPLIELFREGFARATELERRARRLVAQGWAAGHPRAFELLDPPVRERMVALLRPRPLYFELAREKSPGGERSFRTLTELDETRVALEIAEVVGGLLFGRLGFDLARAFEATPATPSSTLFLTLLGWHAARGELRVDPLPRDAAADFLRNVASRRTAAPDAPARALEALLRSLIPGSSLSSRDAAVLAGFGRACLERLAAECGSLDPGVPPDPRRVRCLLLLPS